MPKIPEPTPGMRPLADIRAGAPPIIDEDWKDEFVDSLMRELRRQLYQIENCHATTGIDEASLRSQNVQSLVRIERTLTHVMEVHEHRALRQDKETAARHDDALRQLEKRIDRLIAAAESEATEAEGCGSENGGDPPPSA